MADQFAPGGSPLLVAYSDCIRIPIFSPGLCQCGCGENAPLAVKTLASRNWTKGKPIRFIHGHQSQNPSPDFERRDCGYLTQCWVWLKCVDKGGYGRLSTPDKHRRATHVYFEHFRKITVPSNMHLDHLCRVHPCVNPDHLEIVTPAENVHRGDSTQFDQDDVVRMIALRKSGAMYKNIATLFGTSERYVKRICYGERWVGSVPASELPYRRTNQRGNCGLATGLRARSNGSIV